MSKSIIEKLGITQGPYNQEHRKREDEMYATEVFKGDETFCTVHWVGKKMGNGVTKSFREEHARLFAAAPEMLEALIDLIIDSIDTEYNEIHPRYSRSRSDKWILENATKKFSEEITIIEKATGKSWEEIMELLNE